MARRPSSPTPPSPLPPLQFNPEYPSRKQLTHDMFWALFSSTLVSSGYEVALMHLHATGRLPLAAVAGDAWWADPATVAWILLWGTCDKMSGCVWGGKGA